MRGTAGARAWLMLVLLLLLLASSPKARLDVLFPAAGAGALPGAAGTSSTGGGRRIDLDDPRLLHDLGNLRDLGDLIELEAAPPPPAVPARTAPEWDAEDVTSYPAVALP